MLDWLNTIDWNGNLAAGIVILILTNIVSWLGGRHSRRKGKELRINAIYSVATVLEDFTRTCGRLFLQSGDLQDEVTRTNSFEPLSRLKVPKAIFAEDFGWSGIPPADRAYYKDFDTQYQECRQFISEMATYGNAEPDEILGLKLQCAHFYGATAWELAARIRRENKIPAAPSSDSYNELKEHQQSTLLAHGDRPDMMIPALRGMSAIVPKSDWVKSIARNNILQRFP